MAVRARTGTNGIEANRTELMAADDVGLCNCATCGRTMIGERTHEALMGHPRSSWPITARAYRKLAGRINGRPYCHECIGAARYIDRANRRSERDGKSEGQGAV
jgi:hypothetical protein